VSWNEATLALLSAAGMVTLLLIMLREILLKVIEVVQAWRAVRRALRKPSSDSDEQVT
jgi:hypothetical protein